MKQINKGGRGIKSTERDERLLEACAKKDKTQQQLAYDFGITRGRLLQILRKYREVGE